MKENSADITNEDLDLYKQWQADLELLESFPGEPAFDIMAQELREAGPPDSPELYHSPLIIDTDIGGDPDDAIAIAIAARSTPELALVVTSDECGGERARFARYYLDLLGRPEVPVVAGRQLSDTRYHVVDGLVPADVPPQPADVLAAVDRVADSTDGPIRWCGIGPLSNLADVLAARPQLRGQFRVTQMGGAINYRRPERAEHNFRMDPAGTIAALATAHRPWLVISDVTFRPEIDVTADHWLYRQLRQHLEPWAQLASDHMDRWFERFVPGTMQHDPLTLSTALGIPFVQFDYTPITLADDARMRHDPDGTMVFLAREAHYGPFMQWIGKQLGLEVPGA